MNASKPPAADGHTVCGTVDDMPVKFLDGKLRERFDMGGEACIWEQKEVVRHGDLFCCLDVQGLEVRN